MTSSKLPIKFHYRWFQMALIGVSLAALLVPRSNAAAPARHVIHVSVDGLQAGLLQEVIDAGDAPHFKRLQDEGASTMNARTDYTHTVTLPNHTSMLTGRPVLQPVGMPSSVHHGFLENAVVKHGVTLHNIGNPHAGYIASVFDVVHDAGLSTALYASKDKFVIFDQSYDSTSGASGPHGRDKIDLFYYQNDGEPTYAAGMNARFLSDMASRHFNYVFIHYRDTDSTGHSLNWGGSAWRQAVKNVDGYLSDVLHLVESDPQLHGTTAIILTADHGGLWFDHNDPTVPDHYTIPVLVWGAGVEHGDLYEMNTTTRTNPGSARVDYNAPGQPIRNGDTGNLALNLLGLGPIPGSMIDADQDLRVTHAK